MEESPRELALTTGVAACVYCAAAVRITDRVTGRGRARMVPPEKQAVDQRTLCRQHNDGLKMKNARATLCKRLSLSLWVSRDCIITPRVVGATQDTLLAHTGDAGGDQGQRQ